VSTVKAITYHSYGGPDVLELGDIEVPAPGDDEVLIRVQAASVNPYDWHFMRGKPYFLRAQAGLRRPKVTRLGADVAGTVEAVGRDVTGFRAGDDVFGQATGAFAEYVCGRPGNLAHKPAGVSFEDAATLNIAGLTALQGLRDKGRLEAGRRVLVNGASGGVGTFAVQIAGSMGAEVTAVCSSPNLELVRSLGAAHTVDYTHEDFTQTDRRYDLILDTVATRPPSAHRRLLEPEGIYVAVGSLSMGDWIGPVAFLAGVRLAGVFRSQTMTSMLASVDAEDLGTLGEMTASGSVKPVIERVFPLEQTAAAMAHVEAGHTRGKVVVTP
jgi:NADPH:quinone reductase-like Zn-dependent oxidoreductase